MDPRASLGLVVSFTGLVALVVSLLLWVVHLAAGRARRDAAADTKRAALALGAWLAVSAALASAGVLADFSLPPKLPLLVLVGLALTIWLGASRFGAHLAANVPLWLLVGVNAFRLPLELLMHHAYTSGVMPVQMSYSGQNFDIITGVGALAIAVLSYQGGPPLRLSRLFNIVGFALLLNIVVIAVLSMPGPLRVYTNEPANTWVAHFPFVWLPTVLVPTALLTHILILRRLVSEISGSRRGNAAPAAPHA